MKPMRRLLAVMLALTAVAPVGCFTTPPDRAVSRYDAKVPFSTFVGEDVVQLDVYLVERPAADPCINREVWELADEQVLQERKSVLDENGFRAGVLGEMPPDGLQALLNNKRSCPTPRRLRLHAGQPATVVLGPVLPGLRCRLHQDGRTSDIDLEQAECVLLTTTHCADDGKLSLHFTPAVRHGQPTVTPKPVQDPSGTLRWEVQAEQPVEQYDGLGWDLTVAPNTYLAVGALPERAETLGAAAFVSDGPPRTQRLLVLRASRAAPDAAPKPEPDGQAPPLASQAGRVSARGAAP